MANERAKLVYNDIRYYDEDLAEIGKREAKVMNCKYVFHSVSRKSECIVYGMKLNGTMISQYNVPFTSLNYYHRQFNIGKAIEKEKEDKKEKGLVVSLSAKGTNIKYKKVFSNNDIMDIGKVVADDMNSICKSFVINEQTKSIEYKCSRSGIDFTINVKLKDLNAPELVDIGKIIK